MSQQDKENRIIEKIRKLFALAANDGATGAESENAMRMANAMLDKHSIEMSQLTGTDETVFCTFADYNIKPPWVKTVIGAVCKLYNCRQIFDYNWPEPKTMIIGTGANRMTTTIVIDQLIDQIKKESVGKGSAFRNGAGIGLYDVVNKIINERKADKTEIIPGTGLVPLDQMESQMNAANIFVEHNFKNLTSSKSSAKSSQEGRKYGQGLNPGARVQGEGQRRLS